MLEDELRTSSPTDRIARQWYLGLGESVRASSNPTRQPVARLTPAARLRRNAYEREWRSRNPEAAREISRRYEAKPETRAARTAAKRARRQAWTDEDRAKRNAQDRERRKRLRAGPER